MMVRGKGSKSVCLGLSIVLVIGLSLFGCATDNAAKGPFADVAREKGPAPTYYDFGDVLVPHELKVHIKDSFVYRTSGFSAGVLVLSGYIEVNSLIRFFENNMIKDNWSLVSTFKSPRTIMLFQKENRWCIINVTDRGLATDIEIWVAPTIEPMESGLLK